MPRIKASAVDAQIPKSATQEERTRVLVQDFRDTFKTASGQRVLAHLLNFTGLTRAGWDDNPQRLAYNAGVRSVGFHIVETLATDPGAVVALVKTGEVEELFSERNSTAA